MLLREFIKNTIFEIIEGVKLSQTEMPKIHDGVMVNPPYPYKDCTVRENNAPATHDLTKISFDIAVTTTESKEKKLNGGIEVISGGINSSNENSKANRVQFDLKVLLPSQSLPEE